MIICVGLQEFKGQENWIYLLDGRFSAIFIGKGDKFCDFLFAILQTKPLLKKDLL